MYKLSNDAIEVISAVIKDSKKDYKISSKNEMIEFCFVISFAMGMAKKESDKEQEEKIKKVNATLKEIGDNLEDIDYEDLNKRISL